MRAVSHIDKRVGEALRLGFDRIYLPAGNRKNASLKDSGKLIFLEGVRDIDCWGD